MIVIQCGSIVSLQIVMQCSRQHTCQHDVLYVLFSREAFDLKNFIHQSISDAVDKRSSLEASFSNAQFDAQFDSP